MKIFIAGCGRSGTTLIRDLMKCFRDTDVFAEDPYGEAPFSAFAGLPAVKSHQVVKRTGGCWKTLPSLPDEIGLIYCVRHPFDTLTSTHPRTSHLRKFHITFKRWQVEYQALHQLRQAQPQRRIFILRYEDLVHTPNAMQNEIAAHFGLEPAIRFQENPEKIEIFTRSLEKWKNNSELQTYLQDIPYRLRVEIQRFCDEFGYTLPNHYLVEGLGPKQMTGLRLVAVNNLNDLEVLDGKPFFWMGGDATILDVDSPVDGKIIFHFDGHPGPSHPASPLRHLRVAANHWETVVQIRRGRVNIKIPVKRGENEITLEILEKPTVSSLANGDSRPLMLGVHNFSIDHASWLPYWLKSRDDA
jgi:hypothetical protein